MTPVDPVRILIVDDHPLVRRALAEFLSQEDDLVVVGEAATEQEALERIAELEPDLAIIDISLHGGDGRRLIKKVKSAHPGVKMLVSSMHDEALYAQSVLDAGALGYVNKQDSLDMLIVAVREVLQGHIYVHPRWKERFEPGAR